MQRWQRSMEFLRERPVAFDSLTRFVVSIDVTYRQGPNRIERGACNACNRNFSTTVVVRVICSRGEIIRVSICQREARCFHRGEIV